MCEFGAFGKDRSFFSICFFLANEFLCLCRAFFILLNVVTCVCSACSRYENRQDDVADLDFCSRRGGNYGACLYHDETVLAAYH